MNETDAPRCPTCGYTLQDCKTHGDHHLCDGYPFFAWEGHLKTASPPPQQPEVAVSERDRELASEIRQWVELIALHGRGENPGELERMVARHMATERAEAAAWETVAKANADALAEKITQLAATEAKLREAKVLIDKWADAHQAMSQKIESAAWDAIGTRGTVPRRPHPHTPNAE